VKRSIRCSDKPKPTSATKSCISPHPPNRLDRIPADPVTYEKEFQRDRCITQPRTAGAIFQEEVARSDRLIRNQTSIMDSRIQPSPVYPKAQITKRRCIKCILRANVHGSRGRWNNFQVEWSIHCSDKPKPTSPTKSCISPQPPSRSDGILQRYR